VYTESISWRFIIYLHPAYAYVGLSLQVFLLDWRIRFSVLPLTSIYSSKFLVESKDYEDSRYAVFFNLLSFLSRKSIRSGQYAILERLQSMFFPPNILDITRIFNTLTDGWQVRKLCDPRIPQFTESCTVIKRDLHVLRLFRKEVVHLDLQGSVPWYSWQFN